MTVTFTLDDKESPLMKLTGRDIVLAVVLMLGPALAGAQDVQGTTEPQPTADLVVTWPDPVLQWNAVALATAGGKDPVTQQRILTIAHLAVFEAVNAITGNYEPYLGALGSMPGASAEAAAVAAAYAVLVELVPEQAEMLAGAKASSLARIADGGSKDMGIALGEAAARAMIDYRLNDGFETPESFVPSSTEPGQWQLTPACPPEGGVLLHLRNAKPFAIERSDQFRSDPPPSLTSRRYARDLNEVKTVGAVDSPNRSPDRADVARFYAAVLNVPTWNPVARQIALAQERSLSENARAFALFNMAMTDALISVFETKYQYTFWRPETAIAAADADDNPKTDPDPAFQPFIPTPCHPSYGSAHAVAAGAAHRVLERIYGQGPHAIELYSAAVPDVRLQYTTLQGIANDIDDARIYGGIHFRFDQQAGARQGWRVARYVQRHWLRPVQQGGAASPL
jgi:PAP2 superfamily